MSVESWARRTSGLLVPAMGFATARWRWQCWGCGCSSYKDCNDCYTGGAWPSTLWLDVPAPSNGTCSNCSWYGQTYALSKMFDCFYQFQASGSGAGPCGPLLTYTPTLSIFGGMQIDAGQCQLAVIIGLDDGVIGGPGFEAEWRLNLDGPVSQINHTLTLYAASGAICDFVGSTVDLYE